MRRTSATKHFVFTWYVWEELLRNYSLREKRQWKETYTRKQETDTFSDFISNLTSTSCYDLSCALTNFHYTFNNFPGAPSPHAGKALSTAVNTHLTFSFLHSVHLTSLSIVLWAHCSASHFPMIFLSLSLFSIHTSKFQFRCNWVIGEFA